MSKITLRVMSRVFNKVSRVYRRGLVLSTYRKVSNNFRYVDLAENRCNNCKGRYWCLWEEASIPRYCPKCRKQLREMWFGKYWDDETDEIPF